MPSLLLSNPLGADDAQRIGLEIRAYPVGEIITVSDYVFATLVRTGYGIPYGTIEDVLLIGDGSPTEATGVDGQWYLDKLNEILWGPKIGGEWPSDPIRPDRGVQAARVENYHLIITYSTGTEVDLGNIRGPAGASPVPASATQQGVLRIAGDLAGTADNPTVPGLADKIPLAQRGAANGVPTLGANSKIPVAQLPTGTASGIPSLGSDSKIPVAQLPAGVASGVASLDSDGKLPAAQLPDLAVTQFLGSTNSQAAMLALVGQRGDWTVRTDIGTTWIVTAEPSNVIGSWTQLSYPAAPVTTVAGKAGAVTLVSADITDATAAATANMVAKRDGNGRMAVAAGSAAGDAANVGQLATFGRDRGTGTTLPATDLRRGDVYDHTTRGLHIYSGSRWELLDYVSGPVEGAGLYAYGHSYIASDFYNMTSAQRYINRVGGRLRAALINRGVSGYRMQEAVLDAIGTRDAQKKWAVGFPGIALIDCTINDVLFNGATVLGLRGYRNSLRAFLHFVSLGSITDDSAWTNTANMTSNAFVDGYGGTNRRVLTGQTGQSSITFTGTQAVVGTQTVTQGGGLFEILVDGVVRHTFSSGDGGVAAGSRSWVPTVFPLTGLTNTTHTVIVRPVNNVAATAEGPFLDYLGIPAASPAAIVIVKALKLATYGGTAGATGATVDAYNAVIDEEAASFSNVFVCDPSPGWDPATMIGSDNTHPNARGHAHIADAVTRTLRRIDYSPGATG